MSRILVTGANGFVGRALCRVLLARGHTVTGLVRKSGSCVRGVAEWVDERADFHGLPDNWPEGFAADCVIHLAARVHVMDDKAPDPQAAFRESNVLGTQRVAQAAQRHGVRRFVFLSSIKAVAEIDDGRPLDETAEPSPQDAYGCSKLEAEKMLVQFGSETGMETVIVRPPLVYGPHVRANFLRMMDVVRRGIPLPLGAVGARRSLVYVDNLADALALCAADPRAANHCFHVADDGALTVPELLARIGLHLQRPARLVPVPVAWLRAVGKLTGRTGMIERLTGDLRVDASLIREALGWRPPHTVDEGLLATACWYRSTHD
ncbi:UDP-glucose 4-epimerase family protein [Burkholderia alba]|uniref:UDP-glucose 4-epimerase family protein n=1 Tax=Burkholderia alba TaxID=2683677 RepID=UPI002B05CBE6|nr:SDR family oxidoreductase [Burkholderia alba]